MRASRLILLTGVVILAGPASAQPAHEHVVLHREDLTWGPAPAGLPAGAEVAVIVGDPFADGERYTLRLRMPRGYTVRPHHHPTDETLTLLRGRMLVGGGDELDPVAGDLLVPGDVVVLPAGEVHWVMTLTGDAELQLDSTGPFAITYVDPADDPRDGG